MMKTPERGIQTTLYCILSYDPDVTKKSGKYYEYVYSIAQWNMTWIDPEMRGHPAVKGSEINVCMSS